MDWRIKPNCRADFDLAEFSVVCGNNRAASSLSSVALRIVIFTFFMFISFRNTNHLTVISSSHRVVGRRESFCRFMCHDFAPIPWAAENTLPLP